jgi:hypothetical protein
MPSDRKFHTSVNNTDIIQQSEDGGGIKLTTSGKFIFGAKHQNVIDQLSDENYTGTVDVNANNQSFIAVMNDNSHAIDVEVPVDHFTSLETPTDNVVTATKNNGVDCSKEFDDDAKIFLTHENNYSNGGDKNLSTGDINKYNLVNLGWDPYGNKNAGPTLTSATAKYLEDYWDANNNNPPQPSEQTKLIKNLPPGLRSMAVQFSYNGGAWWTRMQVAANKLDPNLGITAIQSMNISQTVDPNISNDANLVLANGSAYLRNENNGEKTSTIIKFSETISKKDRALLFVKQYDDIIALYDNDKETFLNTLEEEYRRYYKAFTQGQKDSNEYIQNNPTKVGGRQVANRWLPNSKGGQSEDLAKFYTEYVDLSKKQADKYVDCQYTQPPPVVQTQQTPIVSVPTPSPSVAAPPPPTIEEEQEGIYEANFLPMVETDYISLEDDAFTPNQLVVDAIASGKVTVADNVGNPAASSTVETEDGETITVTNKITPVQLSEINTWVKFVNIGKGNPAKDWADGKIGVEIIRNLAIAGKAARVIICVTTGPSGHKKTTAGGKKSRHVNGTGVDCAVLAKALDDDTGTVDPIWQKTYGTLNIGNGQKGVGGHIAHPDCPPKNGAKRDPKLNTKYDLAFAELADKVKNVLVNQMGFGNNSESGRDTGVLWRYYSVDAGDHYNHIHASTRRGTKVYGDP